MCRLYVRFCQYISNLNSNSNQYSGSMDDPGMNTVRNSLEENFGSAVCCMLCSLCVAVTWVTVVMSIAHGLRLEMSFPCGSMWLTKVTGLQDEVFQYFRSCWWCFRIEIRAKFFTFRSPPSPFRTRCRAVLSGFFLAYRFTVDWVLSRSISRWFLSADIFGLGEFCVSLLRNPVGVPPFISYFSLDPTIPIWYSVPTIPIWYSHYYTDLYGIVLTASLSCIHRIN